LDACYSESVQFTISINDIHSRAGSLSHKCAVLAIEPMATVIFSN